MKASSESILYWINAFVWTNDPRRVEDGQDPKIPFLTYPYQDNAILALNERIGISDAIIEKSRDMGASWICLTTFAWRWLFRRRQSFLIVSRKEALVDGDSDSLFGHLDFIIKNLPSWMTPPRRRNKLRLINHRNESSIEGESTTANLGRGGRRTAILIDEFAAFEQGGFDVLSATADNTNCRIFNSTPNGTANGFYAQLNGGTPRLRFHWSHHPIKGAGLYRPTGTAYEIVDRDFWTRLEIDGGYRNPNNNGDLFTFRTDLPPGEERLRSPWYDNECIRRAHRVEIATQLDIDYQGSAYPFFDPQELARLKADFCVDPKHQGTFDFSMQDHSWTFNPDGVGPLKIWCAMTEQTKDSPARPAPRDDYVIGIDVSMGTGASNSVASIANRKTGEKVAEYAVNFLSPDKFAHCVVALARMFSSETDRPALLIWEIPGPGSALGSTIIHDIKFSNVYFRKNETTIEKRQTQKPGWASTVESKITLLGEYRTALMSGEFLNPSEEALIEAGEYVHLPNGKVEHGEATFTLDPSDSGTSHGDRVIADALASKIIKEKKKSVKKVVPGPPVMSFAFRRLEHKRNNTLATNDWHTHG